ncbi:MAG: Hsp20/alpha crystallin family protein [Candidatus Methanoperedens sp.]|nr:Hsp20/alpha crystallin family protein [Candidatus Methanoperedens sp.]
MAGTWDDFRRFEETMSRLYEEFWGRPMRHRFAPSGRLLPPDGENNEPIEQPFIDVIETDKEVIITAGIPGLEKEDINIKISGDRVEISARAKHRGKINENSFTSGESCSREYCRVISLPSPVDRNKSKAIYNNGVLEVKMLKTRIMEIKL